MDGLQAKLDKASAEYNSLNFILADHIRRVYKSQRKAYFEILISSEDINMLVDRLYFQKIILQEDYNRMIEAKQKAQEINQIARNIQLRKKKS